MVNNKEKLLSLIEAVRSAEIMLTNALLAGGNCSKEFSKKLQVAEKKLYKFIDTLALEHVTNITTKVYQGWEGIYG